MRFCLLLGLLLAACSNGSAADLPAIGEARSLGAEWALVNEQLANGHATATYARTMRKRLREQLQTNLAALSQPHSRYADEIRALLAEPDEASAVELRAHAAALKQIEGQLESA